MARYSFAGQTQGTVATADTNALTTLKFAGLQGIAAQQLRVNEVQSGGEATAATVISYAFGRDSTVGTATLSLGAGAYLAVTDAVSAGAPTAPTAFTSTTGTYPQRSATLGHLITHA